MNMNEDVDIRLKAALRKPPTADNLNFIGDLYFKKGDKDLANHYYHKAVSLLNYAQKDKIVAIYKKIIGHSPDDIKAYEGLLKILLRIGIVSDELKYLSVLAGLYEGKGDMEKAYFAYRRLNELNPHNMRAREFLRHWDHVNPGVAAGADDHPADSGSEEKARDTLTVGDHDDAEKHDSPESSDHPEGEEVAADPAGTIKDRADVGLFSVSLEESSEPVRQEQFRAREFVSGKPRLPVVIISLLTIMVVAASAAFLYMRPWKWGAADRKQPATHTVRSEAIRETDSGNYHAALFRVSEDALGDTDLGKYLLQNDFKDNHFYSITLQAKAGCLPESFIVSPQQGVTFIGKGSDIVEMEKTGKIGQLNKVIYRSNICSKDYGAVFIRFFVYHNRKFKVKEIAIDGLGLDSSLRMPLPE